MATVIWFDLFKKVNGPDLFNQIGDFQSVLLRVNRNMHMKYTFIFVFHDAWTLLDCFVMQLM